MIWDKTVDFFKHGKYVGSHSHSNNESFYDVVALYLHLKRYSKVIIREWDNNNNETRSHVITFVN